MKPSGREELLEKLLWRMMEWEKGRPKRIQHFLKVHDFACIIAKGEGVDEHTYFLLEALGYIHDLGIKTSEEKEGRYDAKTQEKYGEIEARKVLAEIGFDAADVDRISHVGASITPTIPRIRGWTSGFFWRRMPVSTCTRKMPPRKPNTPYCAMCFRLRRANECM